jgi:hypothetical protein
MSARLYARIISQIQLRSGKVYVTLTAVWRALAVSLLSAALFGCGGGNSTEPLTTSRPVCSPAGEGKLRCAIRTASYCRAIRDYPYARNLFCPAAFSAAQTMVSSLANSIGADSPTSGFFYYHQTLADPEAPPDEQAQTTTACLRTRAPWSRSRVVGAGIPLCHLIAYVTSPAPVDTGEDGGGNPLPDSLRAFPQYFVRLYPPDASSLLDEFRGGTAFDPMVRDLGAAARDGFLADYPAFAPDAIYDPVDWRADAQYYGISGGGGGGWGGEIAIERAGAEPLVLLAFGGGGGGGMTSMRTFGITSSTVGAGGGGGMQLADGYRFGDRSYNGLGLGAGVGSDEDEVQYSYFDYEGSQRPARPVHEYNPAVISDYQEQLSNLLQQLDAALASGETVVLRGGGGMGAGAEYLMQNGEEFAPHALSTQAGFQFRYVFERREAPAGTDGALDTEQESAYAKLGDFYRTATALAYEKCGRDYANFACMCPTTHAIVICLMGRELGDPTKIPAWMQQQHCPNDPDSLNRQVDRFTSYQHLLLDNASAASEGEGGNAPPPQPTCAEVLVQYFESLNAPAEASPE